MTEEETVPEPKIPEPDGTIGDGDKNQSEKPQQPWYEKRIGKLTAEKYAAQREIEKKDEIIANLMAGKAEDGTKSTLPPAEIEKLVEQRIAQRDFDTKCNVIHQRGIEEFDDFADAVKTLGDVGILTNQFLDLVTDLDEGQKILHHLGKNPEEADKLGKLSPAKQALALAKLEASLKEPAKVKEKEKTVSKAPDPIKTLETSRTSSSPGWGTKYYDGMSQEEFETWDDKNSRKKRG